MNSLNRRTRRRVDLASQEAGSKQAHCTPRGCVIYYLGDQKASSFQIYSIYYNKYSAAALLLIIPHDRNHHHQQKKYSSPALEKYEEEY